MPDIVTAQVVVSRVIDDDGKMVVRIKVPDPFNAVEILGMLEMARIAVANDLHPRG